MINNTGYVPCNESRRSSDDPALQFLLHMLPQYRNIEDTFEKGFCYHGRSHIVRVWIFASAMSNCMLEHGIWHDQCTLLCAAAGHDVGRLSAGDDLWEEDSAQITINAMRDHFGSQGLQGCMEQDVMRCIIRSDENSIESMLLQSADSLDIARLKEFNVDRFPFLMNNHYGIENHEAIRLQLVTEANIVIEKTYPHSRWISLKHNGNEEDSISQIIGKAISDIYDENKLTDTELIEKILNIIYGEKRITFLKKYIYRGF